MLGKIGFIILSIILLTGITLLLSLRFDKGDMYPAYSSFRTDPLGSKALFESLSKLDGYTINRTYINPSQLECSLSTILFIGVTLERVHDSSFTNSLIKLAKNQNHCILAFDHTQKRVQSYSADTSKRIVCDTIKELGLIFNHHSGSMESISSLDSGLAKMNWPGHILMNADSSWEPLVRSRKLLVLGKKQFSKGSIMALHSSFNLTNQGLHQNLIDNGTNPLLSLITSTSSTILFDEWHLGIVHTNTMMDLMKRFGLLPVIFFALAWFLLLIWNSQGERTQQIESNMTLAKTDASHKDSLNLLLHSNITSKSILTVCKNLWKSSFPEKYLPDIKNSNNIEQYNDIYKYISNRKHTSQQGKNL
jgi:hypothetical protein